MLILKELLFRPGLRFRDLIGTTQLTSDHLSYHLNSLVEANLIQKNENKYTLTLPGKEYANRMDTNENKIEKQPKVSVVLIPKIIKNKKTFYLVQRRLKEPYFGYFGFMSGKIRYGESVFETAKRELKEEANLEAEKFKHIYILHEMVYSKEGNLLEDKFFNVIAIHKVTGEIQNDRGSDNRWVTEKEFYALTPKYHNEEEIFEWYKKRDVKFKEKKYFIDTF